MFSNYIISTKSKSLHKWLFFYMFLKQNFRYWLTQLLMYSASAC